MRDSTVSDEERQREFLMEKKIGKEQGDWEYENFVCSGLSARLMLEGLLFAPNYLLGEVA